MVDEDEGGHPGGAGSVGELVDEDKGGHPGGAGSVGELVDERRSPSDVPVL